MGETRETYVGHGLFGIRLELELVADEAATLLAR